MTEFPKTASIIDAKTQSQKQVPAIIKSPSNPSWNRNELKSQIEFHINSLYGKAIEENIDGFVNLRFFGGSSPIENWERDNFYKLKDIYAKIDEVTNLLIKHNKKGNHNTTLLPVVCKYPHGKNEGDNLHSVANVYFDIDERNISQILEKITSILGVPSLVLASGGITKDKQKKVHIYYKFNNAITGNKEVLEFFKLKKQFAKLVDTDVEFEKPTQVLRLLGSTNYKHGTDCTILQSNKNIYDTQDLLDKIANYVKANSPQLALTTTSTDEETAESLEFPIHQPPLELNDGQVIDYLNGLVPDIFEKGNYELWLKSLFATFHQYKGEERGKEIFTEFSLNDKSRSEKEIIDSINQHWKYSKCEKLNQKVTTFRTIIDIVNNKDFVEKEIAKNPSFGSLVRVFDSTEMFGDTYVLTDKYLLVKITKGSGKNQFTYLKHISDYIDVLGTAPCDANMLHTLVKVKDRKGVDVVKIIPIGVKSAELRLFLINKLNFKFEDTNNSFSYLQKYLIARDEKNTKFRVAGRLGYCEDQNVFLVSYKKNRKDHIVAYQVDKNSNTNIDYFVKNSLKPEECLGIKGSLEDWQRHIANYALGNDLMTFSLCFPFASPFYTPLDIIPLIFNLAGESRKGKTILLNLASSVMGYSGNIGYSSWNSTKVGLENVAFVNNDRVAFVDDLHLADNSTLQAAGYIFVNSIGKSRGSKDQEQDFNIVTKRWRTSVLSTGENCFYAELEKRGLNARGGHANRIIDILAVVYQYGVFQNIHNFDKKFQNEEKSLEKGVKSFIEHLQQAALKYKGTAIAAFYEYIFNTRTFTDILVETKNLRAEWEDKYLFSLKQLTQKNLGDIASRANNFSLIAASATIACDVGILPFNKDYIFSVIGRIFHNYLNSLKDVYLTADDRAIKDLLVKFLNNNLQNGFFDKSNSSNNSIYTKYYGFKRAGEKVRETGVYTNYNYYLAVNQYEDIFKGYSKTIVKRFLQEQDYVLPNESKKPSIDYTFEIKDKDNNKINCNLLNLIALGIVLPDNDPDSEPTPPTDKLKDLPCETTSEASEPIVVNTDSSNSSAVTNTTAVAPSLILPRSNLLGLLNSLDANTLYSIGVTMRPIEPNLGILTDYEPLTLHIFELIKNEMLVIDISTEPFTKEEQDAFRKLKLVTNSLNRIIEALPMYMLENVNSSLLAYAVSDEKDEFFTLSIFSDTYSSLKEIENNFDNFKTDLKDTYYEWEAYNDCDRELYEERRQECYSAIKVDDKNHIMRSREDLASISAGCFQEYVMCAGIVEGGEKIAAKLRYLLLKKKNEKPIVIKLENGLTKEEQEILKPLELVFSKINMDTEQYLPNLNYNWVHFLDIALLTRNTDTKLIQTLKDPFYILQDNTNLEELLSAISNDLLKNQDIFSKIEPEILNEFRYRDTITNEYDPLKHVPY